jgi:hypothetical protein
MRKTAGDTLEAHANIFPTHLLLIKTCLNATLRLASLPLTHPLYVPTQRAASRKNPRHPSPLHHFQLTPNSIEAIAAVRKRSNYIPAMSTTISDAETAKTTATNAARHYDVRIYTDGSSHDGGAGAAASLYVGDTFRKTIRLFLGSASEHTVYEAEAVALILGLHLLTKLTRKLHRVFIGLGNQAVIQALNNQRPKPSH